MDKYTSIRDFGRAAEVQIGNKVGRQPTTVSTSGGGDISDI